MSELLSLCVAIFSLPILLKRCVTPFKYMELAATVSYLLHLCLMTDNYLGALISVSHVLKLLPSFYLCRTSCKSV